MKKKFSVDFKVFSYLLPDVIISTVIYFVPLVNSINNLSEREKREEEFKQKVITP